MSKLSLAGPENICCVGSNGAFQRKSELEHALISASSTRVNIQNGGSERKQY